jgi:hypothetical protein
LSRDLFRGALWELCRREEVVIQQLYVNIKNGFTRQNPKEDDVFDSSIFFLKSFTERKKNLFLEGRQQKRSKFLWVIDRQSAYYGHQR